ncbi:hypothetical protein LCGC14_1534930, partial [marine sediment metagenome]
AAKQSAEDLRERLGLEHEVADLKGQVAAGVLLIAAQGGQIQRLYEALQKLSAGQRRGAGEVLGGIRFPTTQGQPILGGRAIHSPEYWEDEKAKIKARLDSLSEGDENAP